MSGRYGSDERPYVGTFEEQAADFALLRFGNRAEEDAATTAFEAAWSEAIRQVEVMQIEQVEALRKRIVAVVTDLSETTTELADIEDGLSSGAEVDLGRWARLDADVVRLRGLAESLPAQLDRLEERLENPVAYASSLQARFPGLHRPIFLPTT